MRFIDTSSYRDNGMTVNRYIDPDGEPPLRYSVYFEDDMFYEVYETNLPLALLQEYIDADGVILGRAV